MARFSFPKMGCFLCVFWVATAIATPAQTFTTLVTFDGTNGANPSQESLIQGADGNLYGTTSELAGNTYYGTIFKMTPGGKLTTLYHFCAQANCTDGFDPEAGLVQASNGSLYGTTSFGGADSSNSGTVFKITSGGKLTTLYSFCANSNCPDGVQPQAALVQGSDGNLYGSTSGGGTNGGDGTVFKITRRGILTTLHSFGFTDGESPGALVRGTDGNFYGTTRGGGARPINGTGGTIFKITSGGMLTTLYNFCSTYNNGFCTDGAGPRGPLVQASDGNLYGTTEEGGINNMGTVFKISPEGTLTTLHTFDGTDGRVPAAGLVMATDGIFYGTTQFGGTGTNCSYFDVQPVACGTIFKITAPGTLTTLYNFCTQAGCPDGNAPNGLMQSTSGEFYGTTFAGGNGDNCSYDGNSGGCGTVFNLSVGLGPFVETNPTSDKVGQVVKILGTNLTGATAVSFNGTAATFTVRSASEITATVPAGATSGTVQVKTPSSGTLNSNVAFSVVPQVKSFTPARGPEGTSVQITGVSFTQASGVTINGVAVPDFTVNSDTQVTATIPIGVTTGQIAITTAGGTATSVGKFIVTK
jgi:uncharacterized repeat protein (TIGR03803 family)